MSATVTGQTALPVTNFQPANNTNTVATNATSMANNMTATTTEQNQHNFVQGQIQTPVTTAAPIAQELAQPVANIEQLVANYLTSLQALQMESPEASANEPLAFIQGLIAQSPLAGLLGATNNAEQSNAMTTALEQLPQLEQALTTKITQLLAKPQFIDYAKNADAQGFADADPVVAATVEAVRQASANNTQANPEQARSIYLAKAISTELAQAHQQVVNAQAANDPQGPEAMIGLAMKNLAPAFQSIMTTGEGVEKQAMQLRIKSAPTILATLGEALIKTAKALQERLAPDQASATTTTVPAAQPITTSFTV